MTYSFSKYLLSIYCALETETRPSPLCSVVEWTCQRSVVKQTCQPPWALEAPRGGTGFIHCYTRRVCTAPSTRQLLGTMESTKGRRLPPYGFGSFGQSSGAVDSHVGCMWEGCCLGPGSAGKGRVQDGSHWRVRWGWIGRAHRPTALKLTGRRGLGRTHTEPHGARGQEAAASRKGQATPRGPMLPVKGVWV